MMRPFCVKVPASSGNLGPGFDVLGLALGLYNEMTVEVLGRRFAPPQITVLGQGAGVIPINSRNIVFRALAEVFKRARRPIPALRLVCMNRIPLESGLGSSSAALLAGFLAGNHLLDEPFTRHEILSMATEMEGHPDNLASSLFGGIQASFVDGNQVKTAAWPVPKLEFVVAVPELKLSTKKARKAVPRMVPLASAVANVASVAMMPSAFEGSPEDLKMLLNDRLHEPYRARLVPGFKAVKKAAIKAGSFGVTLSGAGPSMLSFTPRVKVRRVAQAMVEAFRRAGVKSQALNLKIDYLGARLR